MLMHPVVPAAASALVGRQRHRHNTLMFSREFRLADDMFAQDSIELLKQSGIDFAKMEARGIHVASFGELLMSSGIVLNEDVRTFLCIAFCCTLTYALGADPARYNAYHTNIFILLSQVLPKQCHADSTFTEACMQVKWITFHSGYDFGYLLKVLTCQPLPKAEVEFFELLKVGVRTHCGCTSAQFQA